jgi:spermidine/putrescine-binding protein
MTHTSLKINMKKTDNEKNQSPAENHEKNIWMVVAMFGTISLIPLTEKVEL